MGNIDQIIVDLPELTYNPVCRNKDFDPNCYFSVNFRKMPVTGRKIKHAHLARQCLGFPLNSLESKVQQCDSNDGLFEGI